MTHPTDPRALVDIAIEELTKWERASGVKPGYLFIEKAKTALTAATEYLKQPETHPHEFRCPVCFDDPTNLKQPQEEVKNQACSSMRNALERAKTLLNGMGMSVSGVYRDIDEALHSANVWLEQPHEQAASSACPICGTDTPHNHAIHEIENWLTAQGNRFLQNGVIVRAKPKGDFVLVEKSAYENVACVYHFGSGDHSPYFEKGPGFYNGTGKFYNHPPAIDQAQEVTSTPHSLAGFRGAFESEHGRKPTEQEIWNAAIRSWRDLKQPQGDKLRETAATVLEGWTLPDAVRKMLEAAYWANPQASEPE